MSKKSDSPAPAPSSAAPLIRGGDGLAAAAAAGFPDCGDFSMRIADDGTWFHEGSPIGRRELVRLFASVLRCEADGVHLLVTPVERGRVAVDDSAFVAVETQCEGAGREARVRLRTNIDDWVMLGHEHPLRLEVGDDGEPRPYVSLWRGLEARILRHVFYHLVADAKAGEHEGSERLGVWSEGVFFPLDTAHGQPAHEVEALRNQRGPPRIKKDG